MFIDNTTRPCSGKKGVPNILLSYPFPIFISIFLPCFSLSHPYHLPILFYILIIGMAAGVPGREAGGGYRSHFSILHHTHCGWRCRSRVRAPFFFIRPTPRLIIMMVMMMMIIIIIITNDDDE